MIFLVCALLMTVNSVRGGVTYGGGRFRGGGLESASEFSSTVQKTFQKDVNVIKPPLGGQSYYGGTFPNFLGSFGSNHVFTQPTVISTGPIEVQPRRRNYVPVDRTLIGYHPHVGVGLPAEEESFHIYKEESESLSKRPLVGGEGVASPVGVGLVQADNTEKLFRKSSVSRPVVTGRIY